MDFVITIDTEEDGWGDYSANCPSVENIGRIPAVQDVFDRFAAVPTYLIDYPVVSDANARGVFLKILNKGRCEIGMHCHPWNTPPLTEERTEHNSMLCNLPQTLITDKLSALDHAIQSWIGIKPTSFRAGRWGFDTKVAYAIHSLGYAIDSSVTPLVSWKPYHGPDFESAPIENYRFEPTEILQKREHGALTEIQPTIGYLRNDQNLCRFIRRQILNSRLKRLHMLGLLDKAGIVSLRWLSPEMSSLKDMIRLIYNAVRRGVSLLNFTFHSNSLLPGKSPFVRTAAEFEAFFERIRRVLEYVADQGANFLPLSAAADRLLRSGMPSADSQPIPSPSGQPLKRNES